MTEMQLILIRDALEAIDKTQGILMRLTSRKEFETKPVREVFGYITERDTPSHELYSILSNAQHRLEAAIKS